VFPDFSMEKKSVFMIIIIAMLITLALSFMFIDFKNRFTGLAVDTYLEDLKIGECTETGNWDLEDSDYKLTQCPSNLLMKGVGIAVTKDAQSGGRAYCCDGSLELYDCKDEGNWEKDLEDYKITFCSKERPFMKAVGTKVNGGQQAGGKALCCKAKDVEIYNCAVTSYWKDVNKNHKLTVCPEDRPVMSGVGFNVQENYQYGGKAYCCSVRVRLSGVTGEVEVAEDKDVGVIDEKEDVGIEEVSSSETISGVGEEIEKEGGFCSFAKKIFC